MGDVSAATSDIVAEESGEEGPEKEGGKLSLRMRLVTPVEEGSSERFSLQSKGPRWGRVRGPAGEGGGDAGYREQPETCCCLDYPCNTRGDGGQSQQGRTMN